LAKLSSRSWLFHSLPRHSLFLVEVTYCIIVFSVAGHFLLRGPFPLTLVLLSVASLVLDTVYCYLRKCVRRSAANGVANFNVPPGNLGRFIDADLPEIFRPPWATPLVFGAWLIVGLALLIYGIISYGFLIGLGIRLIPWGLGRLFATVFDSYANPSLQRRGGA